MFKKKIRLWMVLTLLIPFCFGMGFHLDDCTDECAPVRYLKHFFKDFEDKVSEDGTIKKKFKVKIVTGDKDVEINNIEDLDKLADIADKHVDEAVADAMGENEKGDEDFDRFNSANVNLPDFSEVKKVIILSRRTDWMISQGTKASLSFDDDGASFIQKKGDTLTIKTMNRGPDEGTLVLPSTFDGSLQVNTMSGNMHIEGGKLALNQIEVGSISGDVEITAWPKEKLALNVTSGNIRAVSDRKEVPRVVQIQSVSGDVDLRLLGAFDKLVTTSVSGTVHLEIPKTLAVQWNLNSVSGDFEGLPEDSGTQTNAPGHRSYTGTYGKNPQSRVEAHNVSGDFHLEQVDGDVPQL